MGGCGRLQHPDDDGRGLTARRQESLLEVLTIGGDADLPAEWPRSHCLD
jgi:hypothetical protein